MAKLKIPQTFRCHIHVQGEQCPCEMTMANTFTYKLTTLDGKAERAGQKLDGKLVAEQAICPWHARYIMNSKLRSDIVRMDGVVSLLERRERQAHHAQIAKSEVTERNQFLKSRYLGRLPSLGAALVEAGITS